MKVRISLENAPDCELAHQEIFIDDTVDVDDAVSSVIDSWVLSVGDTIKIREVA